VLPEREERQVTTAVGTLTAKLPRVSEIAGFHSTPCVQEGRKKGRSAKTILRMVTELFNFMKQFTFLVLLLMIPYDFFGQAEQSKGRQLGPRFNVDIIDGACELNNSYLDFLVQGQKRGDERIFIIAKRNIREKPLVDTARLSNAVGLLTQAKDIPIDRIVTGIGKPVTGAPGRLEFYLGSEFFLLSLASPGKQVCLQCCESPRP
jgi:hypothetical protein